MLDWIMKNEYLLMPGKGVDKKFRPMTVSFNKHFGTAKSAASLSQQHTKLKQAAYLQDSHSTNFPATPVTTLAQYAPLLNTSASTAIMGVKMEQNVCYEGLFTS